MANPTLLDMPIARDGNKNTIPTTDNGTTGLLSQQYGWQLINAIPPQQGGKAVKREDFNGVFNLLSNILFYAQKGWQWEFDETQNYFAGCTVKDTADGKTYVCIADVNASTTHPSSDTTHWKLSDLATKGDLAKYLPLSGGKMTGTSINRNIDDSSLSIRGGNVGGGSVNMYGKDFADREGMVQINAEDSNNYCGLNLFPDNQLTHRHNDGVDYDLGGNAIARRSLVTNGYVKFADGRLWQWGSATGKINGASSATPNEVQFPITFDHAPHVYATCESTSSGVSCQVSYIEKTNFRLQTSTDNTNCHWLAIGW